MTKATRPVWVTLVRVCAVVVMIYSVLFIASALTDFGSIVAGKELLPLVCAGMVVLLAAWRLYLLHRWAYCLLSLALWLLIYSLAFQPSPSLVRPWPTYIIPGSLILIGLVLLAALPGAWKKLNSGF